MDQIVCAIAGGVVYLAMGAIMDEKEVGPELLMRSAIFAVVFFVVMVLMAKMGMCCIKEESGSWFSNLFK